MKDRRRLLYVIALLLIELSLSFYVFNYTIRTRAPAVAYRSDEEVHSFDISNRGDSLAVGTTNGSLYYYQKGKSAPQWWFDESLGPLSVLISEEGDYVVARDGEGTVSLFRALGSGENTPRWSHDLGRGEISGIHVTGGMPTLVYVLATEGGRILLLSNRDGLLWQYSTGTEIVMAELSFDGRHVAAADAAGMVYLFEIDSPKPVWTASTSLVDGVISTPQASYLAVGGGSSGEGRVYSLSMRDGGVAWEWLTSSLVRTVHASSDGSRVVAHEENGDAWVITNKGGEIRSKPLNVAGAIEEVAAPSYGSYSLAFDSSGSLYFLHDSRSAPLWRYDADAISGAALTSTGNAVFVWEGNQVSIISNDMKTGFIPGSRSSWGFVFFAGIVGVALILLENKGRAAFHPISDNLPRIMIGLIAGGLAASIFPGGTLAVVVGSVSFAAGCLWTFKKEGFSSFVAGLFASVAGSIVASVLYGLSLWFSGVEYDLVTLLITRLSDGVGIGFMFGLVGMVIGSLMTRYDADP